MAVRYEIRVVAPSGHEHRHELLRAEPLRPGDLVAFRDERWLVERIEEADAGDALRAIVVPARFRVVLRHPDGREEAGAVRPYHDGGLAVGDSLATEVDGEALSWQVVEQRLVPVEDGTAYLELVAERDYAEAEAPPELEGARPLGLEDVPAPPVRLRRAASSAGPMSEIVALDAGEEPDWVGAESFVDALVIEEVSDELLENCGVDPARAPRERWLDTVKHRLGEDLARFRRDVELDHDQIEIWETGTRTFFASTGAWGDEADPDKGHGWLSRLVDSGALAGGGFERVREADL